jgi:hypothetical protein
MNWNRHVSRPSFPYSLSDAAIVSGTLDGKVTLWERGRNDYLRI